MSAPVISASSLVVQRADRWAATLELTKPGITSFIMLSAATGYFLAPDAPASLLGFLGTVIGVGLTSAGAATLNEYREWSRDALMLRTRTRPVPSGRVSPEAALAFGALLTLAGVVSLALLIGSAATTLAALSWLIYVTVYTPLKCHTPYCTLVGAIPGALPIVAGWSARGNWFDPAAWTLFAVIFCWQMPHFLSLAWRYRADYQRGGFQMLVTRDATGSRTSLVSLAFAALLAIATTLPHGIGLLDGFYGTTAPLLSVAFFLIATRMRPPLMERGASRLFLASLVYLPSVLLLMVVDRLLHH